MTKFTVKRKIESLSDSEDEDSEKELEALQLYHFKSSGIKSSQSSSSSQNNQSSSQQSNEIKSSKQETKVIEPIIDIIEDEEFQFEDTEDIKQARELLKRPKLNQTNSDVINIDDNFIDVDLSDDHLISIPKVKSASERKKVMNATCSLLGSTTKKGTTDSTTTKADTFDPKIPRIRIKLRINNKCTITLLVPKNSPFQAVKDTLTQLCFDATSSTTSSTTDKSISLEFDGDKLMGKDTPELLDMDDDNLVDVKVRLSVYT